MLFLVFLFVSFSFFVCLRLLLFLSVRLLLERIHGAAVNPQEASRRCKVITSPVSSWHSFATFCLSRRRSPVPNSWPSPPQSLPRHKTHKRSQQRTSLGYFSSRRPLNWSGDAGLRASLISSLLSPRFQGVITRGGTAGLRVGGTTKTVARRFLVPRFRSPTQRKSPNKDGKQTSCVQAWGRGHITF